MEKETLEEALDREFPLHKSYREREAMFIGAKWAQERICSHNYILTSENGFRVIKCQKCNNVQPI